MSDVWLVVGLGNPGPRYELTRHNIGALVVDELAERAGAPFKTHKASARVAEGRLGVGGPRLVLAKLNSFMNVSGGPVSALLRFYSLPVQQLIVIHDDLDLPPTQVRLKQGGGHGGHNGLRDIVAATGSKDFFRVRMGIGRPPGAQSAADFVLAQYRKAELTELEIFISEGADATELVVQRGLTAAQAIVHAPQN